MDGSGLPNFCKLDGSDKEPRVSCTDNPFSPRITVKSHSTGRVIVTRSPKSMDELEKFAEKHFGMNDIILVRLAQSKAEVHDLSILRADDSIELLSSFDLKKENENRKYDDELQRTYVKYNSRPTKIYLRDGLDDPFGVKVQVPQKLWMEEMFLFAGKRFGKVCVKIREHPSMSEIDNSDLLEEGKTFYALTDLDEQVLNIQSSRLPTSDWELPLPLSVQFYNIGSETPKVLDADIGRFEDVNGDGCLDLLYSFVSIQEDAKQFFSVVYLCDPVERKYIMSSCVAEGCSCEDLMSCVWNVV